MRIIKTRDGAISFPAPASASGLALVLALALLLAPTVVLGPAAWASRSDAGSAASRSAEGGLEYVGSTLWSKAFDVTVDGDYAYAAFLNGLKVIDVRQKRLPYEVSQLFLGGGRDIEKRGPLVYLAAGDKGLKVVDVSDPKTPRLVGSAEVPGPGSANAVAVGASHVFVAGGESGLLVFDASSSGSVSNATLRNPPA